MKALLSQKALSESGLPVAKNRDGRKYFERLGVSYSFPRLSWGKLLDIIIPPHFCYAERERNESCKARGLPVT